MDKIKHGEIKDVVVTDLKIFKDNRGAVFHMIKKDSPTFKEFGEVYFSKVLPGVIKGWKLHKRMIQNIAVPFGKMKFVLYDDRDDSETKGYFQEITLSEENYKLLTIPPNVWYSFGPVDDQESILANCASMPHDPSESETLDLGNNEIPYKWQK